MALVNGTDNSETIDQNDGVTDQYDDIYGKMGDDDIFGLGGGDSINAGSGDDKVWGGEGDDRIYGDFGFDTLRGENGNDLLVGGPGGDQLFGGEGFDYASYSDSSAGVTVNLATGSASGGEAAGDTLFDIEGLYGSQHADTLIGNDLANYLGGGGGADTLEGGLGDDTYAIDQDDTVIENENGGNDAVFAYFQMPGSIKLPDNVERLFLSGDAATEINATGSSASDFIYGSDGANRIKGLAGDDTLEGDEGKDVLVGGLGNDILNGEEGADTLTGGRGKDSLFGGVDADVFDFNSIKESVRGGSRDIIQDFQRGTDDIDLVGIDAKTGVSGNQKFTFIGKQDFHDKKGELRYEDKGSKVIVQGDVDGDGKADFEILVKAGALSAGDFIL
ncbi:MAG: calcium-binding protein [Methyloceanibacter sp.]|uniref:calcium-binding protein n=1 Tax=Methyloceanibacter sp. TaxID=1965321 RepID=UPI003D6D00C5